MSPMNTKVIYLIRHAQARHNVDDEYHIHDAPLTDLGQRQAETLLKNYPELKDPETAPEIVLVSPLTRTLQTAIIGFKFKDPRSMLIPMAELQERSSMPCDTGSELSIIRKKFPDLDFSHVPEKWNCKEGEWAEHDHALKARGKKLRTILGERPESRIAVLSHGSFISHLLEEKKRFDNVECKKFELRQSKDNEWTLHDINDEQQTA